MADYFEFSRILQDATFKEGRTQAELAKLIGVSRTSIWRWMNGESRPQLAVILRIASVLELGQEETDRLLLSAGYDYEGNGKLVSFHEIGTEIIDRGREDVLTYLRSLTQGETMRYEAKLIIVGEGGTGKSSLLRALLGMPFDASLSTTHGIEIQQYQLTHPNDSDIQLTMNVWDFGGQQIYHTTHQFFMTQRSLYIVVWSARGETDQGRLDHWLRNIEVLAPEVPVLLVATHVDERPVNFNYSRFEAAYPQLRGWIGVSNKTGAGIDTLRKMIAAEASKLTLMGQKWPTNWVAVEIAIHESAPYFISSKDFSDICSQNNVSQADELLTLGGYLHDLGKILYYQDDDALSDFIVLKPNWLTQTMARVLDDDITRDQNHGVLDHSDFPRIWPIADDKMRYERRLYPLFHRLLERYLICYQLEESTIGHDQSLVPLLLPHALLLTYQTEKQYYRIIPKSICCSS